MESGEELQNNMNKDVTNAAKWSTLTEISAKLITPIVNIILARVIAPEAFGVVATATMIVSFGDMFTDAGFQKYIVQHEFKDRTELFQNANVAFLTNFLISWLIYLFILGLKDLLAIWVGNPGYGEVIAIASLQIILTSFSSIQMALYRRDFNYKTLFYVRMISVVIPIFITLPLAFFGLGYWAIILGNLGVQLSNAFILTLRSKWKPSFYFKISQLKEMFSFSVWSLIEAISIWLTNWVDSFIIGTSLSQYDLGLYKNSTTMVNSLFGIITQSTTPVLFSSLSRLQEDELNFNLLFLKFQRVVATIVLPLGVGVFLFSDLVTQILLGNQWLESSNIIGIWALTGAIMIVFGNFCSELYRAKGRPKLSFIAQILHLIVLIPICIVSVRYGFWALVYARSLVRLQLLLIHYIIMKFVIRFPMSKLFINIVPTTFSTLVMGIVGYWIKNLFEGMIWSFIAIFLCVFIYIAALLMFRMVREDLREMLKNKSIL